MVDYNLGLGLWKSFKNWFFTVIPAITAGWLTFVNNLPSDQQMYAMAIAGFIGYMFKNFVQVKLEE